MTRAGIPVWSRSELVYCSNVHPCGPLDGVKQVIGHHVAAVRRLRGLETMGSGLWLSADAARELSASTAELADFARLLAEQGIELSTLNGFPYGTFHGTQVKAEVYRPDWSEPERLEYTLNLARILAYCMPQHQTEGTISTLPLGFAPGWDEDRQQRSLNALCELVGALARLYTGSRRRIRVCLEMEPGCRLESTRQALHLFTEELPLAAARHGLPQHLLRRHLGICFDVCHQAVMFEDVGQSLSEIAQAGIVVGKIQISSALELVRPEHPEGRDLLREFAEPRYLHQVRTRDQGQQLLGTLDLPQALAGDTLPVCSPWRIHFHLPIQTEALSDGRLGTTRSAITSVLDHLSRSPGLHPHLEVETYTWQVLPPALRPSSDEDLQRGLHDELRWLEEEMSRRGMLRESAA